MFNEPNVGLSREPFVSGTDRILDRLTEQIPDAAHGFTLLFSPLPFPWTPLASNWVVPNMVFTSPIQRAADPCDAFGLHDPYSQGGSIFASKASRLGTGAPARKTSLCNRPPASVGIKRICVVLLKRPLGVQGISTIIGVSPT